jgi:hypothetical protein
VQPYADATVSSYIVHIYLGEIYTGYVVFVELSYCVVMKLSPYSRLQFLAHRGHSTTFAIALALDAQQLPQCLSIDTFGAQQIRH